MMDQRGLRSGEVDLSHDWQTCKAQKPTEMTMIKELTTIWNNRSVITTADLGQPVLTTTGCPSAACRAQIADSD